MLAARYHFQAAYAALVGGVLSIVDVILHLGAHRTGTTTLQVYLENNRDNLNEIGTEFWGPNRTRSGLFSGLIKKPAEISHDAVLRGERSCGLIRMELDRLARSDVKSLIVSEENMIGAMANNLAHSKLYADAKPRLARFQAAFGERCKRVAISVRAYDKYWTSVLAYMLVRGREMPDTAMLDRLVTQPRRWRDIIQETAAVFPRAELVVWPFEGLIGQVDAQLAVLNGGAVPPSMRERGKWHNASAGPDKMRQVLQDRGELIDMPIMSANDTRWQPFGSNHLAAFREQYEEDIAWLRSGADGIATYVENSVGGAAGIHLRPPANQRGQINDPEERSVG
ncbi:MAG TPA: hypothetical protein DD729_01050 [Rhodobacteraceae bacterium]|jgi:hypothetical protein|nr:hypothetical protein [Paracoccaceae bacterium]